jgi:cell division septation protein DedD
MDQYIAQLLQQYDKVVVPKLGTFTSKTIGTALDQATNELQPPGRQVAFSILEDDDGGLFEKIVSQQAHLDKPSFDHHLLSYVQQIYNAIGTTGAYHINGVGTLRKDSQGAIALDQQDAYSLLGDPFGLPSLAKKVVAPPPPAGEPAGTKASQPEYHSAKTADGSSKTASPNPPAPEKKPARRPEVLWWSLMIPLAILFVGLLFLFFNEDAMNGFKAMFGKGEPTVQGEMRPADQEVAEDQTPAVPDEAETNSGTSKEPPVADEVATSAQPSPTTDSGTGTGTGAGTGTSAGTRELAQPAGGDYFVNLGAFSVEKTAKSLQSKLKKRGYEVDISLHPEKKLYRVRITGFATEQAANLKAAQLNGEYPGAWVGKN